MGIPKRIRNYEGRFALVDGIPFKTPVKCQNSPVLMAIFTIDPDKARQLMPGNELYPFRLWKRGLLVITVVDYLLTNIGNHSSSASPSPARTAPAPRHACCQASQKHYGLGRFVYDLPVSAEISVKGGKGIWACPSTRPTSITSSARIRSAASTTRTNLRDEDRD